MKCHGQSRVWAVLELWSLSPVSCSCSLLFHTVLGKSAYLRKTVTPSGEEDFSFRFALKPLYKVEQTTTVHPGESGYKYIKPVVGNVIILCISWPWCCWKCNRKWDRHFGRVYVSLGWKALNNYTVHTVQAHNIKIKANCFGSSCNISLLVELYLLLF